MHCMRIYSAIQKNKSNIFLQIGRQNEGRIGQASILGSMNCQDPHTLVQQ